MGICTRNPVGQTIVFCRLSGSWLGEGLTDHKKRWSVPPRTARPPRAVKYTQTASGPLFPSTF